MKDCIARNRDKRDPAAYCATIMRAAEKADRDTETAFRVAKLDTDRNLVFGWASIAATVDGQTLVDKQGDIIPPDELETAAYDYVLEFREADEMHTQVTKGHLIESLVATPEKLAAMGLPAGSLPTGWWVGFKMDPATFAAVKAGRYPMFSIEGTAERAEVVGKYSPDQPRDPGGTPTGGQWTSGGGGTSESRNPDADKTKPDRPFSRGTKVRVKSSAMFDRGKRGTIVRYDNAAGQPGGWPFYVIDIGEYESIKVPWQEVEAV